MAAIGALWRRSHWVVKWFIISFFMLVFGVAAEKTGLWVPDMPSDRPPFDEKACRFALAKKDYPSVSFDELAGDIQFGYRRECGLAAIRYQGYADGI